MKTTLALIAIVLSIALTTNVTYSDDDHYKKSAELPKQLPADRVFGKPGDPQKVRRAVNIDMSNTMYINPAKLTIERGETVRFVIKNSGKDLHYMVIGTPQDLEEHAQLMMSFPGMVEHAGAYMTFVAPGKTQEIVWQFTEDGDFNFGCVIPGHSKEEEVGKISVVSPQSSSK